MSWIEKEFKVKAHMRGFSIITEKVITNVPEIKEYKIGILHLFIKHTSASLSMNENADSTVLEDMESHFNKMVPENMPYYKHTFEGSDDMPAHIKSTIIGNNITIPIKGGKLNLGTWQGIYLCEHRDAARERKIIAIINGLRL